MIAAALDLGTTRIKGALLAPDGRLSVVAWRDAPPITGDGLLRQSPPEDYLDRAKAVLEEVEAAAGADLPLGIASQRSTFLLWEPSGGAALTPLISWQDRRAEGWCRRHAEAQARVAEVTGLRLSPHYAGPKLAALEEADPTLRRALEDGEAVFGTLETYLLARLSARGERETDVTMAARTLLADPVAGRWHPDLLRRFCVPLASLPRIRPSARRAGPGVRRFTVAASLADQAAAAAAVLGGHRAAALVSLGTGGFVLRMTGRRLRRRRGYLAGPALWNGRGQGIFTLEGTIHGVAAALARRGEGARPLPERDPEPRAFALPDDAGVGAPHWAPDPGPILSADAERLDAFGQGRALLEGIVFRVREILEDLFPGRPPGRVFLAGGAASHPGLAAALAACLGRPVWCLDEAEATVLGAARLAAGRLPWEGPLAAGPVRPAATGSYLPDKYPRWRLWVQETLAGDP